MSHTDTHRTQGQPAIITVSEAQRAYPEDLPDYRRVEPCAMELWHMRYRVRAARGDEDKFVCRDDVWVYLLSPQEQLAFLCYMAVRTRLCRHDDLSLERFSDQGAAVAVELLLTEDERAIALSPTANRVRIAQLTILADTAWDVLCLPSWQREDRLQLLA